MSGRPLRPSRIAPSSRSATSTGLNRRTFLAGAGGLALAPLVPGIGRSVAETSAVFPEGFVWGAAASAPQTEGSDGRGLSVWDVYLMEPGIRSKDGSTLRVTEGFDILYETDIDLIAGAGLKAYRFSFAWPRVQPDGKGAPNPKGLDLYDRILDAMLERGLAPWPTTFHWDVPAALGDWRNRDVAYRYADYAAILARRFGDRIPQWIALNEPNVVALIGYAWGGHAPGLRSLEAYYAAVHHQNLAIGLGIRAMRETLPSDRRVGTAQNVQPVLPADGRAASNAAARLFDAAWNRLGLDPLFGRGYPEPFAKRLAPLVRTGDLAIIDAKPDFLGVNYYSRFYITVAPHSLLGAEPTEAPHELGRTSLGWPIEPEGLTDNLLMLKRDYGDIPVVVTEFGASFADPLPENGVVADPERVDFIRGHLAAMQAAIAQGANLKGAFYWSATDNWEWMEGFTAHFGLIQVARPLLVRTPKQSLHYYGACARENRVI